MSLNDSFHAQSDAGVVINDLDAQQEPSWRLSPHPGATDLIQGIENGNKKHARPEIVAQKGFEDHPTRNIDKQ